MNNVPVGVCGMPCGLCPMFHISTVNKCTGCSKDNKCKVYNCSEEKGIQSCSNCKDYRCSKIEDLKEFPNFDLNRIWEKNISDMKENGYDNWMEEYSKKVTLIEEALNKYNAGSSKNLICRTFMIHDITTLERIMKLGEEITDTDPKKKAKEFKKICKSITK